MFDLTLVLPFRVVEHWEAFVESSTMTLVTQYGIASMDVGSGSPTPASPHAVPTLPPPPPLRK